MTYVRTYVYCIPYMLLACTDGLCGLHSDAVRNGIEGPEHFDKARVNTSTSNSVWDPVYFCRPCTILVSLQDIRKILCCDKLHVRVRIRVYADWDWNNSTT